MVKLNTSMTMPEERERSSRSRRSSSNTRRSRSRSQSISRQSSLQIDMSRQSSTSQKSVHKLKQLAADLRQQQSTASNNDYQQFPDDSIPSSPNRQPFDIEQQHSSDTATSSHKSTSSSYLGKLLRKNTDNSNQQPSISQSFSTGRGTTYQLNTRPYKGFSTSFCGLFATSGGLPTADHLHPNLHTQQDETHHQREIQLSHLRTDLCSLPCFGVLQADYTRYLFTHTRPPTFCKRMSLHVLIPLTIFLFAGWCSGNIRNLYANRIVCTSLMYFLVCWIIGGCIRARKKRVMVREEILWRLKRREEKIKKRMDERRGLGRGATPSINTTETEEYEYYSDDEEEYYKSGYMDSLGQTRYEMNCAHRMLGCYPSDLAKNGKTNQVEDLESDDYVLQQDTATVEMEGGCGGCEYLIDTNNGDLCTKLYRPFTKPCLPCIPCWNGSYGFHVQFCGLCGLAQEAREANLTLPRHLRMIDYITMEPFLLYYPRIVELRMSATSSFWEQIQALSSLSTLLLVTFKVILIGLFVIGLSSAVRYWQLADVAVLITTFLQSFVVMYVIHWWRHRLDLSIDAAIKYFACGFVLCSGMAFTIELLEYLTFKLGVMIAIWIAGTQEVQDNGYGGGDIRTIADSSARLLSQLFSIDNNVEQHGRMLSAENDILRGFFERNPMAKIFYILISSYIMAGLVEEVCKYFSWVMVDHPDFCSEKELAKAKATMPLQLLRDQAEDEDDDDDTNGEEGNKQNQSQASNNGVQTTDTAAIAAFDPSNQRRSLASIRGGVTTSMVAVALGFTCCENIFTIFIWNRSNVQSEIATLVVKSLFPVNALAAAIQSIYVCRRDLEKDKSIGLGRSVLPSVIFHGTYDFALLMITSSWQRSNKEQYFNDAGGDISVIAIISFCASFFIVLLGGLYYFSLSRAQYKRLRGSSSGGSGSVLAAGLLT